MHLSPGMMVSTNVRLTRPLGEGAMGAVWVADHLTLKTEVAVKFISASLALEDPEIVERFSREASMAAQIKSPHVVQTFDQGVMGDGTPYIVMELLEGESLQDLIERQDRLGLAATTQIVAQVARALAKAHSLGIVHRDIKPDNIFITHTEDGMFAKILDFGIAKQTRLPQMGGLTNPGMMVGTPEYMSPEQVLSAKDVDFRADIWALAVTTYYCLTGTLPFTAEALGALCVKLLDGKFTPPSHLNPMLDASFDAFFIKALAHTAADRHTSARELANELAQLVTNVGAGAQGGMGHVATQPLPPPSSPQYAATEPLPPTPLPTAPLPAPSASGPLPAVVSGPHAAAPARSGTFSGSSSTRKHPGGGGWRVGAAIAGAVAVLAVIGGIAMLAAPDEPKPAQGGDVADTGEPSEPSPPAPPDVDTVSPAGETTTDTPPTASAEPSAEPSAAPTAQPTAKPSAQSGQATPTPPPPAPRTYPKPRPKPGGSPEFPDM